MFNNLKKYDFHLIIQELGKFNLETNVSPNGLEKYMSFTINNKLCFIERFQPLCSSLDSLVKNLDENDFKYLSQELDNNVLDLIKQEGFDPYGYMSHFESFKEELPSEEKFYSLVNDRKNSGKVYEHVLNV